MKKLELVATMAMGVVLAGIISIDPMRAAEEPEIEVFVPTWEQCVGDMEADWESPECQAQLAVKIMEDHYGPEYYLRGEK